MSGGGIISLSLLSRGVGEVRRNGQEKIDVLLEPSDYYNLATERPFTIPAIQTATYRFHDTSPRYSARAVRNASCTPLPKTFTTRKGALLLFSEELALKAGDSGTGTGGQTRGSGERGVERVAGSGVWCEAGVGEDEASVVMKTVDDLARSVLQYGAGKGTEEEEMHLKFIHPGQDRWQRQIRPGYSAKRYLSTWTRTWDSQVLHSLLANGYLKDYSLFGYLHLRQPVFHLDLSSTPQPYRLLRSMLLIPASLSGFTFYRVDDILATDDEGPADTESVARATDTRQSIRVIRTTADGVREEIRYCALDRDTQLRVLVDLLVKSAVHFALATQQELVGDPIPVAEAEKGKAKEDLETLQAEDFRGLPLFDMREAVESLLESQRGGPYTLGVGEGPETDVASPRVLEGGGFRRPPLPVAKAHAACQTSRGTMTSESRGELAEPVPVTSGREVSTMTSDSSSVSSVPQLPPIAPHPHPLSPIKDVSRETSQLLNLPALRTERQGEEGGAPSVHVMPATPQHSTLTELPALRTFRHDTERSLSEASGYNLSSDSSVTADPSLIFAQRSSRRAKAKGSGRHYGARRPSGGSSSMESPSLRGSLVLAPDGEIIQVGGTIPPPPQQDVGVMRDLASQLRLYDGGLLTDDSGMSDEDEEWRRSGRGRQLKSVSPRKAAAANKYRDQAGGSGVTEQDILDTLTEQAKLIADALLDKEESGADLERDVREAADMWMEAHPARDISRHQPLEEALKSEALEELVAAYRESSADPTAAQYRQLIRQSLTLAVAKGAGLSPDQIPEDLDISPELLEALVSQTLSPEALTIGYDPDTGRPVIRAKQQTGRPGGDSPQPAFSALHQDLGETAGGGVGMTKSADSAIHSVSAQPDSLLGDVSPGIDYGQKAVEMAGIPSALLRDSKRADKSVLPSGDVGSAGKSKKGKKDRKKKGQKKKRGKREEESGQETEGDTPGSPPPDLTHPQEPVESASDEPLSLKSPSGSSLSERALQSSPEPVKSDDEAEFPAAKDDVQVTSSSPEKAGEPIPFPEDEDEDDDDSEEKSQANREARAARRAAAAAKRKEEVERRRKEREEQQKMTKGELERQEQLKQEMENERLQREEERRLRRLRQEEEAEREARQQEEERRRLQQKEERERREKEEHQRRLEEMRREQMEEEERRNALLLEKEREEERRRAEEEDMLSQMAEQERAEYERMKREEEEARKAKEEEDRRERAAEAERAMAEARRLAEEMARKQAALEAKLQFNRSLRREARSLGHSHDINRAFVFSYFQLLQWLGLDIPQLELAKMRR